MRNTSCVVAPIRNDAFFKQTVLEREVGNALLQRAGLPAQILDLVGGSGTGGVTSQPAFAGLEELLRPHVIQALGNAFLAARSAMLSSPRRPSSTIRILSSAEKCRRVVPRMSFTTCSAGFLGLEDLGLIFVPSSLRRDPNPP